MNYTSPIFITLILTGCCFLIVGWIMSKYPPKKINQLYGYRTKRSMQSQESWDLAQTLSISALMKWGTIMCFVSLLGWFDALDEGISVLIAIVLTIIGAIMPILETESALKKSLQK